jgi:hypothetical protein
MMNCGLSLKIDVSFDVDTEGIMVQKKSLTGDQSKIYKKYHRVRGILVYDFPYSEYTKILDDFTTKAIFESLCSTCEGNQHVKEDKAN